MGFSSVARMVDGAMAASWQANLGKVTERLGYTSAAELIAVSPWLQTVQQECKDAFELVTGRRGAKLGDKDDGDFKQSAITKRRAADTKEAMMANPALTAPQRASIRSAGGKGAGSWLRPPTAPNHFFDDRCFEVALCMRMDLDIPNHTGTCRHCKPDGTLCGAPLDPKGRHARACRVQGCRVKKHDRVKFVLQNWCEDQGCTVQEEVVMPTAADNTDESRMDLVIRSPNHPRPIHVDVTIADATSIEALSKNAANRDAAAAQVLETRKIKKHPNIKVMPFCVESHGRFGDCAAQLARLSPSP